MKVIDNKYDCKFKTVSGIVICCLLCSITLFVYSHRFVNVEVTPKWLYLMLAVGIASVAGGLLYRKNLQLSKPVNILLTGSLLFILVRAWATSGVLWIYPLGLLLLFYLVQCLVLPEYEKLHKWLGKNGLFLYNHAAELHEAGDFEMSIAVFKRCIRHFNDMDVQMLLADNYKKLGQYTAAEQYLKTAAAMCPARLMPLYELVKLYDATGRRDEALALAKKIIDKDVKIPSFTITTIKNEIRQMIEVWETSTDPENDSRSREEPEIENTRQGETPQVQPNGAALPP